ncbi:hypothetical protein [Aquimarina sp. AU474]|uniref:hypothetical protein n=1 Tax=Aquimarina sp. AU474 TaxID=2108529 RepID=UPI000D697BEE|nr:hypothetical protein [Aquimarina sp. AU474]
MKNYNPNTLSLLNTPYLDNEILGFQKESNQELNFSNQLDSPFLMNELFDETEIEDPIFINETENEMELDEEFDHQCNEDYIDFEEELFNIDDEIDEDFDDEYSDNFEEIVDENEEMIFEDEYDNELIEYENSFNVRRAIRRNKYWARKLNWEKEKHKIRSFLQEMFPHIQMKSDRSFAQGVELWQRFMNAKKPDGIIGPKTWSTLQGHIANRTTTTSPTQIPTHGVDNSLKNISELSLDIYEAKYDMLKAWEASLKQFYIVMKSASDAEVSTNFAQTIQNFIKGSLIATFAAKTPLKAGTYVLKFFETINKEQARASEARNSADFRDFMIKFINALTRFMSDLRRNKADYFTQVRIDYENMNKNQQTHYKEELVSYIEKLDKKRQNGWLSGTDTFKKIAFAWIRYSKVKNSAIKRGYHESFIQLWVNMKPNKALQIKKAKINAPGGRKIAEQLIKNARNDGTKLKPYKWPVFRVIIFHRKSNNWPYVSTRVLSNGNIAKTIPQNKGGQTLFKRLFARKSTTMRIT